MAPASMLVLCALLLSLMPEPTTCISCAAGTYSEAGASTCTNCVAGKYNSVSLTPVVASGLLGLSSSISIPILEEWTKKGATEWKWGSDGESCMAVCSNSELYCISVPILANDAIALFKYFGKSSTTSWDINPYFQNIAAPSCVDSWKSCYYKDSSWVLSCSAYDSYPNHRRLCACGPSLGLVYTEVSNCTNCVAGKYSTTVGASQASTCMDCVAGKYSNATGVSTCMDCVAGTYSNATGVSACFPQPSTPSTNTTAAGNSGSVSTGIVVVTQETPAAPATPSHATPSPATPSPTTTPQTPGFSDAHRVVSVRGVQLFVAIIAALLALLTDDWICPVLMLFAYQGQTLA